MRKLWRAVRRGLKAWSVGKTLFSIGSLFVVISPGAGLYFRPEATAWGLWFILLGLGIGALCLALGVKLWEREPQPLTDVQRSRFAEWQTTKQKTSKCPFCGQAASTSSNHALRIPICDADGKPGEDGPVLALARFCDNCGQISLFNKFAVLPEPGSGQMKEVKGKATHNPSTNQPTAISFGSGKGD